MIGYIVPASCDGLVDTYIQNLLRESVPELSEKFLATLDTWAEEGLCEPGTIKLFSFFETHYIATCFVQPNIHIDPEHALVLKTLEACKQLPNCDEIHLLHSSRGWGIPPIVIKELLGFDFIAHQYFKQFDPPVLPIACWNAMDPQIRFQQSADAKIAAEALNRAIATTLVTPPKKWHRRLSCYHPSSVSTTECDRFLAYDRLGTIPRPRNLSLEMQLIFLLGHSIHDGFQNILSRAFGDNFAAEVKCEYEILHISGNSDGVVLLVTRGVQKIIVEFKTTNTEEFNKTHKPKSDHVIQVHCYMISLDIPIAVFVYIDRQYGKYKTFGIVYDNSIATRIVTRLTTIEHQINSGVLPDRHVDSQCTSCNFYHVCQPPKYIAKQ